jgi:hypothetical protein
MRGCVDAERKPARDREADPGEVRRELPSSVATERRGVATADDRKLRQGQCFDTAVHVQNEWRVRDLGQQRWIGPIAPGHELAVRTAGQPRKVRRDASGVRCAASCQHGSFDGRGRQFLRRRLTQFEWRMSLRKPLRKLACVQAGSVREREPRGGVAVIHEKKPTGECPAGLEIWEYAVDFGLVSAPLRPDVSRHPCRNSACRVAVAEAGCAHEIAAWIVCDDSITSA